MLSEIEYYGKGVSKIQKGSKSGDVKRDLVGRKFGSLTVLDSYISEKCKHGTRIYWLCRCNCGYKKYVERNSIRSKTANYCEMCRPIGIRHTKLYHIYHGMKQRCYNPNSPSYALYGERGIKLCDTWLNNYDAFREWSLSHGYSENSNLTIDRIDSDKGYSPENCQWILLRENSAKANYGRQKNFTKLKDVYAISIEGTRIDITNISAFCVENNLNYSSVNAVLHGRMPNLYHGWTFHSNKTRS